MTQEKIKNCNNCGVELVVDTNWSPSRKRKKDYVCKACHGLCRGKPTAPSSNYERNWKGKPQELVLLATAKRRAQIEDVEFSITVDDVSIPDLCPVFGIELNKNLCTRAGWSDNAPSLDLIDPARGYVPGNVAVISWRANNLRQGATLGEIEAVIAYMRSSKAAN